MRVSIKTGGAGTAAKVGGGATSSTAQAPMASTGPVGDALSVSSGAHFVAVARARISGMPDVRLDRVEALRASLDSDTYHPDPEAVAEGLLKEHTPRHLGS
ncbi:MAG TPA: flagellar biosynthesis anti-sigma factor FlgM [Holophaga sp.]|nr:flagellar biosynthesis anti-sigma factor FlgM [Holophaga sp.]